MLNEIDFTCASCCAIATVSEDFAGQAIHCPHCGHIGVVPKPIVRLRRTRNAGGISFTRCFVVFFALLLFAGGYALLRRANKPPLRLSVSPLARTAKETDTPSQTTSSVRRDKQQHIESIPAQPPVDDRWRDEARHELALFEKAAFGAEPTLLRKPDTMTQVEYSIALHFAKMWMDSFGVHEPPQERLWQSFYYGHTYILHNENAKGILGFVFDVWEKEAMQQFLSEKGARVDSEIDSRLPQCPRLRALKDRSVQSLLRGRLAWKDRRESYQRIVAITKDPRRWSLLHPFDELSREEMERVEALVMEANEKGLAGLSREDRKLLFRAGQTRFVARLIER